MVNPESSNKWSESLELYAPRPVWQEAILFSLSFGIQTCFWMVGRARDFKALTKSDVTPWLWFFLPGIAFAQLIGLPKIIIGLDQYERPHSKSRLNWRWGGLLWVLLITFATLASYLIDRFAESEYVVIFMALFLPLLYLPLHLRFNRIKRSLEPASVSFIGRSSGFAWYEWVVVLVGALMLGAVTLTAIKDLVRLNSGTQIEQTTRFVDEQQHYFLVVEGGDWYQVPIGSYSDGTAEMEFALSRDRANFMIFDWGMDFSLEEAVQSRSELDSQIISVADCKEVRRLSPDQTSVVSTLTCPSRVRSLSPFYISVMIESSNRVYEFRGASYFAEEKQAMDSLKKVAGTFFPHENSE